MLKRGKDQMTKILVVDDVPSELEMIGRILKKAGMEVVVATNGEEAIARIQETAPDLVILDVVMPRMNGFEVIRELRGDRKTSKLPVVFCSQKNTEIDKTWGIDLGADAYITKPVDPQQLVHIVERLL
jgi:twitching motility two-component system response regulator PilH